MAEVQTLAHPPLREAIIDLRTVPIPDFTAASLEEAKHPISEVYGSEQWDDVTQDEVSFEQDGGTRFKHSFRGLRLRDATEKRLVTLRNDGIGVSRLAPYSSWSELLPEALEIWRIYREAVKPKAVTRIAARFINSIELPWMEPSDLGRYLQYPPPTHEGLPSVVHGFLFRYTVQDAESGIIVHWLQQLEEIKPEESVTVLIDIDAFAEVDNLDPERQGEEVTSVLAEIQSVKNRAFFESITQEGVDLFQ